MTRLLASSFIMLAAASAFAVDPYIGYIYPSGIQAGTTNRFIIGGQAIAGARNFRFSGGGINVLKVQPVPNFAPPNGSFQRKHLIKWLDGIAAGNREEPPLPTNDPHLDEWRSNSWWKVLGTLDEGQLAIVEYDLHVPKNALQSSPSLRQMSLVTIAADADAKPGCRSFVAWNFNGFSAPRPFYVTSARHVAEPLYVPPHRAQPEPPFVDLNDGPAVLDGQILPGSTDVFRLRLAGGRRYVFNVTARELQPYIGDAVPGFFNAALSLKGEQGEPVAFADDNARFRPDPLLEFSPPSDGTYRLEIRDVLYRGRFDFVYAISVGEAEETPRPKADGVVSRPGAVALKKFTVHSPGPRVLEVLPAAAVRRLMPSSHFARRRADRNWQDGTMSQTRCSLALLRRPSAILAESMTSRRRATTLLR